MFRCRRLPSADVCQRLLPLDGVILQRSSPPLLRVVANVAGSGWQSTIASLLDLGEWIGVEPSAFGSLLWQHQTGLTYLSPRSDLDVLWPVPADFDVLSLASSVAEIQRDASLRIDGEVVFPDGSAVNWRELWNEHRTGGRAGVLAKSMEGVRLLDISSLCRYWVTAAMSARATNSHYRPPIRRNGANAPLLRKLIADQGD